MKKTTREISVFVDESGSFEADRSSSRFYMVCMVFHDQAVDIKGNVENLNKTLTDMGLQPTHCVHAGPLIRREKEYATLSREERRGIFGRMMAFLRKTDISYKCFCIDKTLLGDRKDVHDPFLQSIVRFLIANSAEFTRFDTLKVYYDNGQAPLSMLLKEAFAIFSSRTVFVPAVEPTNFRLFQVADLACTIELARCKLSLNEGLSESENVFFGGTKNFKKNYLKLLDRKLFQGS